MWITIEGFFWFPRALLGFTKISREFPEFRMVGHFNKMVMDRGEQAIREEFERLMPLMKSGGFIPGVDHQTPPNVTIEQYRLYRRLLDEYTTAAAMARSRTSRRHGGTQC